MFCSNIHQILAAMCLNLLNSPLPWGTSAKWLWSGLGLARGPNGDGSCVRLLSPCHQCVCSWSHPFLANASVPVPILTLTLASGRWTVEVRGGRQRGGGGGGGGEDKLHTSHLPSPPPPTPQHCTLGTWDFWLSKIVKLRQGSGKDRQGMAVKAKGLKA